MNHERQQRNIQIYLNSQWIQVTTETTKTTETPYAFAYTQYKNRPAYSPELPHETEDGVTIYRNGNEHYKPTYASYGSNIRNVPIIDMNDIKIFLTDIPDANWVKARDYQAWAYRDFMYDNKPIKYYASRHSSHLFFQTSNYREVTTIELDGVPPNIIFNISRNENGSVYYEKNDARSTRVRICDNESARSGYLGFYRRMTDHGGFIISPPAAQSVAPAPTAPQSVSSDPYGPDYQDFASFLHQPRDTKLPLAPGVCSIETSNEEEQCILCFKNKSTLLLMPCNHKIMCPGCYTKMEKPECPMCRGKILSLTIN